MKPRALILRIFRLDDSFRRKSPENTVTFTLVTKMHTRAGTFEQRRLESRNQKSQRRRDARRRKIYCIVRHPAATFEPCAEQAVTNHPARSANRDDVHIRASHD